MLNAQLLDIPAVVFWGALLVFQDKLKQFQERLAEERRNRLEERKKQRKEERRITYYREKEEEEQRLREEQLLKGVIENVTVSSFASLSLSIF